MNEPSRHCQLVCIFLLRSFRWFKETLLLLFSRSFVSDSATSWTAACQASLSFTISRSLLKLMSIESVMPSNHLVLCCPLLLLPSIFPNIRVFSNESALRIQFSSVQFSHSVVSDSLQPHGPQHDRPPCPSPTPGVYSLMSIESVMPSNHLILCFPLFLLPSVFPSIRVFSNESALLIRWPKYWSFSFNTSPSNEHPGLISFRVDWFDHLAVQGTLKSLLQHHSSKASILLCSFLYSPTLTSIHDYWKNHSLD